jgi:hypothetical protein
MTEGYFEDFVVGEVFKPNGRVRVDKDDIIAFAQKFDPNRFTLTKRPRGVRSSAAWSRAVGIPRP